MLKGKNYLEKVPLGIGLFVLVALSFYFKVFTNLAIAFLIVTLYEWAKLFTNRVVLLVSTSSTALLLCSSTDFLNNLSFSSSLTLPLLSLLEPYFSSNFTYGAMYLLVIVLCVMYKGEKAVDETALREFFIDTIHIIIGTWIFYIVFLYISRIHLMSFIDCLEHFFVLAIPVWVSDMSGYFIGKFTGKRKVVKYLSPNKTLEGYYGLLVLGTLSTWLLVICFEPRLYSSLSYYEIFMVSITLPCVAAIGDLYESLLKRRADIKDTGALFPGHGGAFDKIDSLLFVFSFGFIAIQSILISYLIVFSTFLFFAHFYIQNLKIKET